MGTQSGLIPLEEAREFDTVLFRGGGKAFKVCSFLLSIFDKEWRNLKNKPWHMGKLWRRNAFGWFVFEGVTPCSDIRFHSFAELSKCRIYRVSRVPVTEKFKTKMEERYRYKKYDIIVYGSTTFQYLILRAVEWFQKTFIPWHKFTISLWRVLNDRYTCWELCEAMDRDAGIDWCKRSRYPLITDFLKKYETRKART